MILITNNIMHIYIASQARSQPSENGGSFSSDSGHFSGFERWEFLVAV